MKVVIADVRKTIKGACAALVFAAAMAPSAAQQQTYQRPYMPGQYQRPYLPGQYRQPGMVLPGTVTQQPTTAEPGEESHVTLDAAVAGPWWIGSPVVPINLTVTNLTAADLLIANLNDPRYANLYLTTTITDANGNVHPVDFPIAAATPPASSLMTLPKIATYTFSMSGVIEQQYFLPAGKYTVNVEFHITNPPYKATATAALEVKDIHDALVSKVTDIKAVSGAADPLKLVQNDVTGHVAIASPYPGAYWAVYWRDELIPQIDKYADDRRVGYKDIPPVPQPIRSGMRYLMWLGPASKDAVPKVQVTGANDIQVSFGAPTKRMSVVMIPKFSGPVKVVTDGNAVPRVPTAGAPEVGPRRIIPAGGPAGSVSDDDGGVVQVTF